MIIILSMFFIASCKKESSTENPTSSLIVTVGEGLTPKYSWTDANGNPTNICRLVVYRADDLGDPIWGIQTLSQGAYSYERDWYADGISPPVTHGVVQLGSQRYGIEDIWPLDICPPLPAGQTYRLKIQKMNGVQGIKDFSR